jgi:hypothetical protein
MRMSEISYISNSKQDLNKIFGGFKQCFSKIFGFKQCFNKIFGFKQCFNKIFCLKILK